MNSYPKVILVQEYGENRPNVASYECGYDAFYAMQELSWTPNVVLIRPHRTDKDSMEERLTVEEFIDWIESSF